MQVIWWAYHFPMLARWQKAAKLISRRCSSAVLQACVVLLVFCAVFVAVNSLYFSTGVSRNSSASLPALVKLCFCWFWFYWKKIGENCFSVFFKKKLYFSIFSSQWKLTKDLSFTKNLYPKLQFYMSEYRQEFINRKNVLCHDPYKASVGKTINLISQRIPQKVGSNIVNTKHYVLCTPWTKPRKELADIARET